jgi:hypothetical protein
LNSAFDVSLLDDVHRQIEELETRILNCGFLYQEQQPGSSQMTASKTLLSPTSIRGKAKR